MSQHICALANAHAARPRAPEHVRLTPATHVVAGKEELDKLKIIYVAPGTREAMKLHE